MAQQTSETQGKVEATRQLLDKARRPAMAVALAGAVAMTASCTGDGGRNLYMGQRLAGNRFMAVGDSLINRESTSIKTQAVRAGLQPTLVFGMEGHSEVGGIYPSGMDLLTGKDDLSKRVQTAVKNSDEIEWGFGSNGLREDRSAEQQRSQDTASVQAIRRINPGIRILMPTLSTGDPVLGARFSKRNIGREMAAEDPVNGFFTVPVYEREYGGDARHVGENPYLHFAPVDADWAAHVHPQTPDGLAFAASIVIAAATSARNPALTYVMPQYQDTTRH
jgi:hypothetical protein